MALLVLAVRGLVVDQVEVWESSSSSLAVRLVVVVAVALARVPGEQKASS